MENLTNTFPVVKGEFTYLSSTIPLSNISFSKKNPHNKTMEDYQKRLNSFIENPMPHKVHTAEVMAEAGFYRVEEVSRVKCYDAVRCYVCNLLLKYWKEDDIPWNEHKKYKGNYCELVTEHFLKK